MNPAETHGAFSWSELMTSDPEAASEFYADILGYSVEDMSMPDGGTYWLLKGADRPHAGIMNLPDENVPPNWGFYVTVDDVDTTAAKAAELGATQVWPLTDVPDVGRMTAFVDPQGAYFAIVTWGYPPMDGPGPDFADAFATHGAFSWFELRTPDIDAAKSFYGELFGWNFKDWPMGDDSYLTINVGEVGVGGIIPPPMPDIPAHWAGYVTVDDSDSVAAAAQAAGANVVGTMDLPSVGRFHAIADPQGAVVTVITYVSPEEAQQGEQASAEA